MLLLLELLYIRLARKLGIGVEREQGGRRAFVSVGGGIIFIIAAAAAFFCCPQWSTEAVMVLAGGFLLAVTSYIDDLVTLSAPLRLVVQTLLIAAILLPMITAGYLAMWLIALIGCVGYINSSNFMDGINGMLAAYSVVVTATLIHAACQLPCNIDMPLLDANRIIAVNAALMVALLVFAIFNFRRRAVVFSGDVGAITVGFFIAVSLTSLMLATGSISMLIVVAVYLIDTFATFVQRLLNGENVLSKHHKHLYQLLVRKGYPQLGVASAYAAIQLAVNFGWTLTPAHLQDLYSLVVGLMLVCVYVAIKRDISLRLRYNQN